MITEEPKKVKIIRRKKVVVPIFQIKCNVLNCEEIECYHYLLHDRNSNCEKVCGVHNKAKCV